MNLQLQMLKQGMVGVGGFLAVEISGAQTTLSPLPHVLPSLDITISKRHRTNMVPSSSTNSGETVAIKPPKVLGIKGSCFGKK